MTTSPAQSGDEAVAADITRLLNNDAAGTAERLLQLDEALLQLDESQPKKKASAPIAFDLSCEGLKSENEIRHRFADSLLYELSEKKR